MAPWRAGGLGRGGVNGLVSCSNGTRRRTLRLRGRSSHLHRGIPSWLGSVCNIASPSVPRRAGVTESPPPPGQWRREEEREGGREAPGPGQRKGELRRGAGPRGSSSSSSSGSSPSRPGARPARRRYRLGRLSRFRGRGGGRGASGGRCACWSRRRLRRVRWTRGSLRPGPGGACEARGAGEPRVEAFETLGPGYNPTPPGLALRAEGFGIGALGSTEVGILWGPGG